MDSIPKDGPWSHSDSGKSITQPEDSVNSKFSISEEKSSDKLYSIDDSADVSEEPPFEKALRRSGLAHLIDGEAEAAEVETERERNKKGLNGNKTSAFACFV